MKQVAIVEQDGRVFLIFEGDGVFWAVESEYVSPIFPHGFALHTVTTTDDELCKTYENASPPSLRIKAIERLYDEGFDVSVRLSPFIPEFVDVDKINAIKCDKILIEFLKVNTWVRKWFDIDYSEYTLKYGGYWHLPLERKIELASLITGFEQVSVGEYVQEHYEYFRNNVNWNPMDCCNLRL